ncbi:UPF0175 family protein [Candidatus Pyrohabitans sp.]
MRIPGEIKREIEKIAKTEHIDRSTALRMVLEKGLREWKKEIALKLLVEGKVTLWKAASIAGIPLVEMLELVEEKGVSLPVRAEDVIDDIRAGLKG